MKRIVSFVFLLTILYQSIGQLTVLAYFQINREVIALTKCENRVKPKLKCAGKCYLTKQLKKLDENRKSDKNSKETKVETPVYLAAMTTENEQIPAVQPAAEFIHLTRSPLTQPSDIFHPPC